MDLSLKFQFNYNRRTNHYIDELANIGNFKHIKNIPIINIKNVHIMNLIDTWFFLIIIKAVVLQQSANDRGLFSINVDNTFHIPNIGILDRARKSRRPASSGNGRSTRPVSHTNSH